MTEGSKSKLLAPIADRYTPSAAAIERMTANIEASLAKANSAPASNTRLAKWVGLSCVALLAAGVSARLLGEHPQGSDVRIEAPPSPIAAPVLPAETAEAVVPVVSVDSLPLAPRAASAASTPSKPVVKAPGEDETLAREAHLLAEAESAFRHGDDARALAFLAEHEHEFPNGALKDERTAERVVVLCHAGRVEQATREGRAFLRNRGSDPLARRVALSCAGTANEAP